MLQNKEMGIFSLFEKHLTTLLRICQHAGNAIIIAMMLLTVVSSIGRYAFNQPVPGLIELSTFMLVSMIFLMIGHVHINKGHVTIGLIVDRFSKRTQAIIDSCTYAIGLVICVLAAKQTILQALKMTQTSESSMVLRIPPYPFYFLISFAWILFGLVTLVHMVHFIMEAAKK